MHTSSSPRPDWRSLARITVLVLGSLAAILLLYTPHPLDVASGYGHFFLLGLLGAIVANSTGAGGGVVFIPAFTSLGVDGAGTLATSIAIQCFGMTAGAISWLNSIHRHAHGGKEAVRLSWTLIGISGSAAVAGMLSAQYLLPPPQWPVTTIFKYFSALFGAALLFVTMRKKKPRHLTRRLRKRDLPVIALVAFGGGMVTAWISVGAGEWLAITLFFLGYPVMITVCVAVTISSLTVLSGIPYHLLVSTAVYWEILLFAAPAAILGGSVARLLAERLGPVRLKVFFAAWILATGLAM